MILLFRWVLREEAFRRYLIDLAAIRPGMHPLDLGCGTATLTILVKQLHPTVEVVGVDGDPKVLATARAKVYQSRRNITLEQGMADRLPYADCSYDRVLSSLVFHHLNRTTKQLALVEVFRVLRPGGEFYLADIGPPHTFWIRFISMLLASLEEASDYIKGMPAGNDAIGWIQPDQRKGALGDDFWDDRVHSGK